MSNDGVDNKMILASSARAPALARKLIESCEKGGRVPVHVLKSVISSPRLFDVYVKDFGDTSAVFAGDSFLDCHTMLADSCQKTYAISLARWVVIREKYEEVENFHFKDRTISKIQVWPFEPQCLTHEQMSLAVAVSYSDLELLEEPRLCGALRDLLKDFGVEFYWEARAYDR